MESLIREELFVGTAELEHIEMYLKAIWLLKENEQQPKVSRIATILNVTQPSVVQMLKKLSDMKLVVYRKGIANLTEKGEAIGRQMIRNSRLLEVLMKNSLKIDIDEEIVCGIEHHLNTKFVDALCTLLNHPEYCPHGYKIPRGECCKGIHK